MDGRASIISCKATVKSFTGPKKGRHPDVNAADLHFVRKAGAKGMMACHIAGCANKGNINY
jgi:hypothetical protein